MTRQNEHPPGLSGVVSKLADTFVGTLRNRGELFVLEWQEERARGLQFVMLALASVFLVAMGLALFTGIIIFLCPQNIRLYVAAGFALLYFLGAFVAVRALKSMLKESPFSESLNQLNKDREWLQSFR
jgi:uncharacterized membrane protein YqjE